MNSKENDALIKIAKHVAVLNGEVGSVKNDVCLVKNDVCLIKKDISWIKKIGYFMATIMTLGLGKIAFF